MPYNPHHKARIRQSIVFEAARVLSTEGPEAIGVAAIMSKLGLTHGGFYAYFRSIDELMAEAIMEIFNERYAWMLRVTEGHPPDEALVRFIEQLASCALATMAGAISLSRTISDRGSSDALLGAAKATVKSQLGLGKASIGIASKDGSSGKHQVESKSKSKMLGKVD